MQFWTRIIAWGSPLSILTLEGRQSRLRARIITGGPPLLILPLKGSQSRLQTRTIAEGLHVRYSPYREVIHVDADPHDCWGSSTLDTPFGGKSVVDDLGFSSPLSVAFGSPVFAVFANLADEGMHSSCLRFLTTSVEGIVLSQPLLPLLTFNRASASLYLFSSLFAIVRVDVPSPLCNP